jgi:hypothetical protein
LVPNNRQREPNASGLVQALPPGKPLSGLQALGVYRTRLSGQ